MEDGQKGGLPPPPEEVKVKVTRTQEIPAAQKNKEPQQAEQQQYYSPYPPYPYQYPYYQYPPSPVQHETGESGRCPACGRSGYSPSTGQAVQRRSKKFLGLSPGIWIIAITVLLVFGCAIASFLLIPTAPHDETHTFSAEVIIAEGGHYRHTIGEYYYSDEVELTLEISAIGGQTYDVYIMTNDQYENSYGLSNATGMVFSSLLGWENINRLNNTVDLTEDYRRAGDVYGYDGYRGLYLVMDNSDNPLTPDDATPQGTITVNMHLRIKTVYSTYYLD